MAAHLVTTRTRDPLVVTALWWALTIAILIVLDDLTFGPIFWVLSRLTSSWVAAAVAFSIYFTVQLFLIWQGTSGNPTGVARWFLSRLQFDRRWVKVGEREDALHEKVAGGLSAVLMAPIIGGVLPPIILYLGGMSRQFVRKLGVVTSAIYASEFAFLHGWIPGTL